MVPPGSETQGVRRYLLVRSSGLRCALPVTSVRRVVRDLTAHPLPGGRNYLVGLSQYGGEPLAILDLHTLLTGSHPRADRRTTVIVKPRSGSSRSGMGLAVDEAMGVTTIDNEGAEVSAHTLVGGSATQDGAEITILEPDILFDDDWTPPEAGNE